MIRQLLFGLLAGLSLLVQAGDTSAPVLQSVMPHKSKVTLTVLCKTASEFHIRVIWQDEEYTQPSTSFINKPQWKQIGPGIYTAQTKIPGDTNDFSVAIAGST